MGIRYGDPPTGIPSRGTGDPSHGLFMGTPPSGPPWESFTSEMIDFARGASRSEHLLPCVRARVRLRLRLRVSVRVRVS